MQPLNPSVPDIRSIYLVFAITALGLGVNVGGGSLSRFALVCLAFTLMAVAFALGRRINAPPLTMGLWIGWTVIFVVAVLQFFIVIQYPFGRALSIDRSPPPQFLLITALVQAILLVGVFRNPDNVVGKVSLSLLILGQLTIGFYVITQLPNPGIDVLRFHEGAIAALLSGKNPYSMRIPDLYTAAQSAYLYAPGLSADGVLQFGYPYLPLTLILFLPGALLGDVRFASLAAMTLSCLLIAYATPGRLSKLASVLLLYSPIYPLMLYFAWTESHVVLLLALVWFCYRRSNRLLPYALGLLLVSKQYMVLMVPLSLLLFPHPWASRRLARIAWKAFLTGTAVTLPWALLDMREFLKGVVFLQFYQPFRGDAMSFLAAARPSNAALWEWVPFALVFICIGGFLWAARRKQMSFPLAVGFCLLLFFAFNKQAFANYYYLVFGAFCCALPDDNMRAYSRNSR